MRRARLVTAMSWAFVPSLTISLAVLLIGGEAVHAAQSVALEVRNPDGPACQRWPLLTGIPFPKGALRSANEVRLLAPGGKERPCQVNAVATWGPGPQASIRWVHLDFEADVPAGGTARYQVEFGEGVARRAVVNPLKATETPEEIEIDTGVLRFRVSRRTFRFIDQAWHDANGNGRYEDAEQVLQLGASSGPYVVDQNDVRYDAAKDKAPEIILEERGPIRAVIRAEGWHCAGKTDGLVEGRAGPEAPKDALCKFIVRIVAYRGKPYVRVFHTFVFTADSNKVRLRDLGLPVYPNFEGEVRFGIDQGESRIPTNANGYLLQVDDERFELHGATAEEGKGGGRAPGWFGIEGERRGLFVAMRDFYQQYPKELEWTDGGVTRHGSMTVHFWPAHGAPITHPTDTIDASNIQRLWFAHEGRELNFRIPPDYKQKFTRESAHEFYYVPGATENANALGLSKTHEMLLCFAKPEALTEDPKTAASLARLFNNEPAALADPAAVCAHGMFDRIHPYDPKQFPKVEEMLEATFDMNDRLEAYTHNTGMFNWGAGNTYWDFTERRWKVDRVWYNTHHGMPRVPWIYYMRSGNPKYLRKALRSTRHVVDLCYCRYTTPEFEKIEPSYPRRKVKGALCDYKGLVHWHSGARLPCYNSMTDFLLYAWYVTGDRRAWEMALEWGQAAKRHYATQRHGWIRSRTGAAMLCSFICLYEATWDETYHKLFDWHFNRLLKEDSLLPHGGFEGWLSYAPWLTRYVRTTNDEQAKKVLLRWADVWCSTLQAEPGEVMKCVGNYYRILGEAYHVSRDPKYLAVGWGNLQRAVRSVWRRPGHLYDGLIWLPPGTTQSGFFMQMAPEFLAALSLHLKSNALPEPRLHTGIGSYWSYATGKKIQTHVLFIDNSDGGAFALNVEGHSSYGDSKTYTAWVLSPAGKEVARGEATLANRGFQIPLSVPDAGKGTYVLKVEGGGGNWKVSEPLDIQPPKRYVRRMYRQPTPAGGRTVAGLPVYVWVPKGTRKFALNWSLSFPRTPCLVRVYDKDGRKAVERSWLSSEETERGKPDTLSIPVEVPTGQDDGLWEIAPGVQYGASFGVSEPIPQVFSIYRDRFFIPENLEALTSTNLRRQMR